jgi:hypothetical protein
MLTRLLFAATLAGVFALPAVAGAHHGGSGIVGPTRVGDLRMDLSTEADVRAFAGEPDLVEVSGSSERIMRLGYHCREPDEYDWVDCRINYEVTVSPAHFRFYTVSKRFRTRRATRVGDTRKRAERNERRKADHNPAAAGPARSCGSATTTTCTSSSTGGECSKSLWTARWSGADSLGRADLGQPCGQDIFRGERVAAVSLGTPESAGDPSPAVAIARRGDAGHRVTTAGRRPME